MHVGRLLFSVAWLGVQGALVLTAGRRPDGAFGFRMFSESSTMKVVLFREIAAEGGGRTRVHVDDGTWSAHDASGAMRRFSWYDRVLPSLGVFDREIHASYGEAAQLDRLQGALDDVASHVPEDTETKRLVLEVTVRKNGHEPHLVTLASPVRGGR